MTPMLVPTFTQMDPVLNGHLEAVVGSLHPRISSSMPGSAKLFLGLKRKWVAEIEPTADKKKRARNKNCFFIGGKCEAKKQKKWF